MAEMDKEKAREFLRRLNALEAEFGIRIEMDGTDGEQHMYVHAGGGVWGEQVHIERNDRMPNEKWMLLEDFEPRRPPELVHIPTKIELKRLGRR